MLQSVRASILGKARQHIRELLGPPSAMGNGTGGEGAGSGAGAGPDAATTWYYPLDKTRRVAMAIVFDHDRVRDVEFLKA